jgi:hypothetical protein
MRKHALGYTIGPDAPLRLYVAARIAYPDGSMTASGLRREIRSGRLECERTAGKQYVTLAGIERMREKCRVEPKAPASISDGVVAARPSGLSLMEKSKSALVAAQIVAEGLKKPLPNTSQGSTSPTGKIVILQK